MEQRSRVIIVCGPICSGKTTFAKQLVEHRHIEVGDIVRKLTRTDERVHVGSLDRAITQELKREIEKGDNIVITGIRQLTILASIISPYMYGGMQFSEKPELIWLDVPESIRMSRWFNRADSKDALTTFKTAQERDNNLGLDSVERYLLHSYHYTKIVKNYDHSTL